MRRARGAAAAWVRVPIVLAAVAAGVAGCAATDRIDAQVLERVLPGQLVPDHPTALTDVACPSPIDKVAGTVTVCTARVVDTSVAIIVTQLDDNGATRAELDTRIFDVTKSAAALAARFAEDLGVSTMIECDGPAVRVLVVGEVLRCTARDPSLRSRSLDVTVRDEQGTLDAALS